MIDSYAKSDMLLKCNNNNICTENFLPVDIILPKHNSGCIVKKSFSFKETSVLKKEVSLLESNDNAVESPILIDRDDDSVLNQLYTSSSWPNSLCDSGNSESLVCGLPNAFDYHLFRKHHGIWPFCPVDVCVRCQDSALTLNNRGACLCTDTETTCPHEDLCGATRSNWSTHDSKPSNVHHHGYRKFENPSENLRMIQKKSQQLDNSAHNNNNETDIKSDIGYDDDDNSSTSSSSSTSTSSSSSSSSSSSLFLFSSSYSKSSSSSSTSLTPSSSPTLPTSQC